MSCQPKPAPPSSPRRTVTRLGRNGAPIFGVAHYGLVADLFEVAEELTEALEER